MYGVFPRESELLLLRFLKNEVTQLIGNEKTAELIHSCFVVISALRYGRRMVDAQINIDEVARAGILTKKYFL